MSLPALGEGVERAQVYYLHDDYRGSVGAITDSDGNWVGERRYDAFGKLASSWDDYLPDVDIGFTGHLDHFDTGLIDMGGRSYDPEIGRFLSPDPFVQAPLFSQSWNRYSYVFNNPMSWVDPSGFEAENESEGRFEPTAENCVGICDPPQHNYVELVEPDPPSNEDEFAAATSLAGADSSWPGVPFSLSDGWQYMRVDDPMRDAPEAFKRYPPLSIGEVASLFAQGKVFHGATEFAWHLYGEFFQLTYPPGVKVGMMPAPSRLNGGPAPKRVPKIKNGPKFPNLKDHAARHSNAHPNAYYNQAVKHTRPGGGKPFRVRHDGQTKIVHVTRTGPDAFTFTSRSPSGNTIFTHLEDVNLQYLHNKGITLPRGF